MSLYPYGNRKIKMDGITATSSSIESSDHVLTYTVLKDPAEGVEENVSPGLETR